MGVLEITLLRLRAGTKYTDPTLLSNLQSIRSQLGTNSRFFGGPDGGILILGTWPSLQAHDDFLNSGDGNEILGPQEKQTRFICSQHIDLGEGKGMEILPLDARRAISVARFFILKPEESAIEEAHQEYLETVAKTTGGEHTMVLNDWRMDPKEGTREWIVIMGRDDLKKAIPGGGVGSEPGLRARREFRNVIVSEDFGYDLEDEAARSEIIKTEVEGSE